jgi:hypothetical protein
LKRWQIAALFASGLALGGLVVWLITRSSDSNPQAAPTSSSAPGTTSASTSGVVGIATNAQALIRRLTLSDDATFHVRYATGANLTSHAILEIWHTPDRVRRDVTAVSPTQGTAHTVEILDGGKYVRCLKLNDSPWQCVGAPTSEKGSLGDPLQGNSRDVEGKQVTLTHDEIVGQSVDCYTVPQSIAGKTPSVYCLSKDNVPLRIDGGDGKPVSATDYDHDVPASIFTPPAPVAGS